MKKIYQCKTLSVNVWDPYKLDYKFSEVFDPNPFRKRSDLELYLKQNGCKSGDEYYIEDLGGLSQFIK